MKSTHYHIPNQGLSVIRLMLEEIGARYRTSPLDRDAGDFDSPAFRAVLQAHEGFPTARRVGEADGLGPTPFTNPRT